MKIRSMYFRNDDEIKAVKDLLAEMRGKPVNPTPKEQESKFIISPTAQQYKDKNPKNFAKMTINHINTIFPKFLLDVMNGGTFPAQEDLTRAEQAILYDNQINTLVNLYRQTKKSDLAQHIRQRLDEIGVDF